MRSYSEAVVLALVKDGNRMVPLWTFVTGEDRAIIDDEEGTVTAGVDTFKFEEVVAILVANRGQYRLIPPSEWQRVPMRWFRERQARIAQETTA